MIFFIRQQDSHNLILTTIMHDKIERIQQMMNGAFERPTSSVKELTEKKNTQTSAGPHAIKTNVEHIFRKKKGRADIQKSRDDRKKSPLNDNGRIIEMQFHSSQENFSQLCTQPQKICFDE